MAEVYAMTDAGTARRGLRNAVRGVRKTSQIRAGARARWEYHSTPTFDLSRLVDVNG